MRLAAPLLDNVGLVLRFVGQWVLSFVVLVFGSCICLPLMLCASTCSLMTCRNMPGWHISAFLPCRNDSPSDHRSRHTWRVHGWKLCSEHKQDPILCHWGGSCSWVHQPHHENKKPSYRWGTARRGRASWNLVKFCTNVDDLYLKSSETRLLPIRL